MSQTPLVVWVGRFGRDDGYGTAARSMVKALSAAGLHHIAVDTETCAIVPTGHDHLVTTASAKGEIVITPRDPGRAMVVVANERPDRYQRVAAEGRTRLVGASYWEAAHLPVGWADEMFSMDTLWASSANNRAIFERSGISPHLIDVVGLPTDVDPALQPPSTRRWGEATVFFSVLSGLHRRDLRALYEAYCHAFTVADDTLLVLKSRRRTRREIDAALASVAATFPDARQSELPRVEIIDTDLTREQLHRLQAEADVYVSSERGNGWCLPAFDAMAMGRPAILFDWGGSQDFQSPDDTWIVPVSDDHEVFGTESVPASNDSYDSSRWPSIEVPALTAALQAATEPAERERRGAAARDRLNQTHTPAAIGAAVQRLVTDLDAIAFRSNHPAVVRVVASGDARPRGQGPGSRQRALAKAARLHNTAGFTGPAPRALARPGASPADNPDSLSGVGRLRQQAGTASALIDTIRDYDTCVGGAASRWPAEETLDRRRAAWRVMGSPRGPRNARSRLDELRGTADGNRVVILGNGPSLNRTPLERLADTPVFGVNKIYMKYPDLDWRPRYFTLLDWRMGPAIAGDIAQLAGTTCFFPERVRGVLPDDENIYWYHPRPFGATLDEQFEPDATRGVPSKATVLVTAIQLAVHLGYRDLVLVGVDASYTIPDTVEQSGPDAHASGTKLYLTSTADDDPNHFSPAYFGAGAQWHDPNVDDMQRAFGRMRLGLERLGGSLRNATVGGDLRTVERVDFDELF